MATTEQVTAGKIVYGGVTKTVLTPFEAGVLSTTKHYTLMDCVEGTTAMTKEDGDVTEIKNEQGGIIFSLITPGTRTFTTEVGDLQDSIITGLFGFKKDATSGLFIEPIGISDIYVQVEIYFANGGKAVGYKVKLNPNVTMEALNTGIVRGVISGTLENIGEGDNKKAFAIGIAEEEEGV